MRELRWHHLAIEEMKRIVEYCHLTFGGRTAKEVRNRLRHDVRLLKTQSNLGYPEPELSLPELQIRSLVVGPTKIIYSVHQEYIYIHLLWSMRRSPESLKKEMDKRMG